MFRPPQFSPIYIVYLTCVLVYTCIIIIICVFKCTHTACNYIHLHFRPLLERENDFCRCLSEMFPELKVRGISHPHL